MKITLRFDVLFAFLVAAYALSFKHVGAVLIGSLFIGAVATRWDLYSQKTGTSRPAAPSRIGILLSIWVIGFITGLIVHAGVILFNSGELSATVLLAILLLALLLGTGHGVSSFVNRGWGRKAGPESQN